MISTSINSYPYISTTSIESVKTTPVETTPVETTPVETTPVETTSIEPVETTSIEPVETTKIINKSTKTKSTTNKYTDDNNEQQIGIEVILGLFACYSPFLLGIIITSIFYTMFEGAAGIFLCFTIPLLFIAGILLLGFSVINFKKDKKDVRRANAPYYLGYGILSILLFIFLIIKLSKNSKDYYSFISKVLEAVKEHNKKPGSFILNITEDDISPSKMHMKVTEYIEYLILLKTDPVRAYYYSL